VGAAGRVPARWEEVHAARRHAAAEPRSQTAAPGQDAARAEPAHAGALRAQVPVGRGARLEIAPALRASGPPRWDRLRPPEPGRRTRGAARQTSLVPVKARGDQSHRNPNCALDTSIAFMLAAIGRATSSGAYRCLT